MLQENSKTALVKDLDNYIKENNLLVKGSLKKQDKILLIEAHIAQKNATRICHSINEAKLSTCVCILAF